MEITITGVRHARTRGNAPLASGPNPEDRSTRAAPRGGANAFAAVVFCLLAGSLAFAQSKPTPPLRAGFAINPDGPGLHVGFSFTRTAGGLPILNFSTVLRDPAGKPMTGKLEITFLLCPSQQGGGSEWSETQTLTADERGVIMAPIGATHPEGFPMGLLNSGEAPWLGLQVGNGPEQQPRFNLSSLVTGMYRNFLQYQSELDREAAKLEAKGEDGRASRGEYQRALGFSDAEFEVVRQTADKLASEMKDLNAQASVITGRSPTDPEHPRPRPTPDEIAEEKRRARERSPEDKEKLKQLGEQRNAVVQQAVAGLRAALGPELAAKVDVFVELGGGGLLPQPLPRGPVGQRVERQGSQVPQ